MIGQSVQDSRNFQRDARSHQYIRDAREHSAVEGRQVWNLNLFQKVDSHGIVMTFTGQTHFHKVGNNAQLDELAWTILGMLRQAFVGLVFCFAAWDIIRFPNALRHFAERKTIQAAPHVPAVIAVLQSSDENLIDRRS